MDIHLRAISQEKPPPSITKTGLETTYLKFHWNRLGANELMHAPLRVVCLFPGVRQWWVSWLPPVSHCQLLWSSYLCGGRSRPRSLADRYNPRAGPADTSVEQTSSAGNNVAKVDTGNHCVTHTLGSTCHLAMFQVTCHGECTRGYLKYHKVLTNIFMLKDCSHITTKIWIFQEWLTHEQLSYFEMQFWL